jgi:hypothetical protein
MAKTSGNIWLWMQTLTIFSSRMQHRMSRRTTGNAALGQFRKKNTLGSVWLLLELVGEFKHSGWCTSERSQRPQPMKVAARTEHEQDLCKRVKRMLTKRPTRTQTLRQGSRILYRSLLEMHTAIPRWTEL